MDFAQNESLKFGVRRGLGDRRGVVYVPWDMPADEIAAKFSKELEQNLVKRLQGAKSQLSMGVGEGGAGAPIREKNYYAPPPSQSFATQPGAATAQNILSQGLGGPCMIEHVAIVLMQQTSTVIDHVQVAMQIVTSKDVGPFEGDHVCLTNTLIGGSGGLTGGSGVILATGRTLAAPGEHSPFQADFFPRIMVPYSSFFINCSQLCVGGTVEVYATIDFSGIEAYEDEVYNVRQIQPRFLVSRPRVVSYKSPEKIVPAKVAAAPAPSVVAKSIQGVAAAAPAPTVATKMITVTEERRFKNYAEMKALEATGVKIVWATVRNTGEGAWGYPLAAQVTVKKEVPA